MLFLHLRPAGEALASKYDEAFIDSVGGRLFVRSWTPQPDARAALVVVHDLNSHGGGYERFASHLVERGIVVHALDLRGHGKSAGERQNVRHFSQYLDDIGALMNSDRVRQPLLPLFMLGHGAGGVAVSLYALTRQQDLAGLICESIALDLPASATLFGWVRALALIAPRLPVRGAPARTVAALLRARKRLRSSLAQLSVPLLVLHGSADTVTFLSGSEHMHECSASPDKTLQIFEGYYHDLINDRGHEPVTGRILQWIENRLSPEHRNQIGIAYINADT
jgi:alpha-beta hydrolase superfamily lysophospholipase